MNCDSRCGNDEEDERSWLAPAVPCRLTYCTLSPLVRVLVCFVYSSVKTERGQIISFNPTFIVVFTNGGQASIR